MSQHPGPSASGLIEHQAHETRASGFHRDGEGGRFVVASREAERMQLCLFDQAGRETRHEMERDGHRFRCCLAHVLDGTMYGYRAYGAWAPAQGLRFNPHKLLLDPYAHALAGETDVTGPLTDYARGRPDDRCEIDSAPFVAKAVVHTAHKFDWGLDELPRIRMEDTVIYEAHVKGLTKNHPGVPEELRGTFEALGSAAVIEHLTRLSITTIELLPTCEELTEPRLTARGLVNYWGYSPAAFFVPARRLGRKGVDDAVAMKTAIKNLHSAGIEVVLDVVFNHTAELDTDGPTLSFRGLCNRSYYRTNSDGKYVDVTGCGNTMAADDPLVCELWMDALRYWATEFHVDGFRFDLGATLARGPLDFPERHPFMLALTTDPILRDLKLIMEPWDIGSYRLGKFPDACSEWNDRYRECARGFFTGEKGRTSELASRIAGSSDLFGAKRSGAKASINYVVAHDGFTLRDLVTYATRHNEANFENNRDGEAGYHNRNYGVEGETQDSRVNDRRLRHQKSLLATLFVSLGVPMIAAGDELGRTQLGNSNAYCQDNALSYLPWDSVNQELLVFTRELLALRRALPELRRSAYWTDSDVKWLRPDGLPMAVADWENSPRATLIVAIASTSGELLLVLNGEDSDVKIEHLGEACVLLDTADAGRQGQRVDGAFDVAATSVVVMRQARQI